MILPSPSRLLGRVMCPICLQWVHWSKAQRVELDVETQQRRPFRPRGADETREAFAERRLGAQRACTLMRDGVATTHYLPDRYGDYGDPIVIGLVGHRAAGKTLLLAAMVEALRSSLDLAELGLRVERLDEAIEHNYMTRFVEPFCHRREQLPLTQISPIAFSYVAKVYSAHAKRDFAVAFFDVAGEQLRRRRSGDRFLDTSFLSAVSALLFVVDPEKALPTVLGEPATVYGDPAFNAVLDRLVEVRGESGTQFLPIPAAMVVAKSDLLAARRSEVEGWLSRDDTANLYTVAEESEEVYEFLATNGAERFLSPVNRVSDVSLHFASAAGVAPVDGHFPAEGFGPKRVLRPLLSLFAMTGVIDRSLLGN
ncbi:hypothetical protein [Dactylosporangium sp. CA-139066]|uniref:hypothetical protein n=1 Tax=Dactylosporangium sp. CA-139066 TaxID=3239930 RepID=UPI003D93A574